MAVGSDGAGEISHTIKTRTSRLIVRGLTQDRLQEAGDIFYLSFLKEDAVTRIPTSPFSVPSRELAAEILGHLSASPHERTVAVFEATTDKLLAGGCIALRTCCACLAAAVVLIALEFEQPFISNSVCSMSKFSSPEPGLLGLRSMARVAKPRRGNRTCFSWCKQTLSNHVQQSMIMLLMLATPLGADQDVHAIGPVFVDPDNQLKGIGRLVMQALLEISRAENAAASVRLTQVR